jgi:hypothetical protein
MVHNYWLYHDIQPIWVTFAEFWGPDDMVALASASYLSELLEPGSALFRSSAGIWPTDTREAAKRMSLDGSWTLPPFWGLSEVYRSSYGP